MAAMRSECATRCSSFRLWVTSRAISEMPFVEPQAFSTA
jgi:hypothetical protein